MTRIQYAKTDGGSLKIVTYTFHEGGGEEFDERDPIDIQGVQFTPSEEELGVARRIREEARKEDGFLRINHVHNNLWIEWRR